MATQAEVSEAVAALNAEMEAEQPKAPEPAKEPEKAPEPPKEPPKEEAEAPAPEAPKPKPSRKAEYIPAAKFHETRHELQAAKEKAKQLEAELEAAKAAKAEPKAESDDEIESVATKHGLDKTVVADIIGLTRRPDPKAKELDERLSKYEAKVAKAEDEARYRNEEAETLAKFPELKPYAKDLKEMAYAEGNERVPLELLALKVRHDLNLTESVAPAEGASAPPAGKARDLTNLTEDEIANLSDAEMDKFIKLNRVKR